jgi:hypothetical protein
MFKRGIAISLYNKFDELAILSDIIKKNFNEEYGLFICSNHPDAKHEIEKRDIKYDGYMQGDPINFNSDMKSQDKRMSLILRSCDTVQKSCSLAMKHCESVLHVHCDAWPLNEKSLIEHFALVENTEHSIAVRGLGWSFTEADRPLGGIDDHFFVFSSSKILEKNIFDFNALDIMPHKLTIHGILGAQIVCKVPRREVLYYDDFKNHYIWDGVKKRMPFSPVKPSLYDQKRKFLHVHRESFPEKLGQILQSWYLVQNKMVYGANISAHMDEYPIPDNFLFDLTARLNKAEKYSKYLGINYLKLGQEILGIEKVISETSFVQVIKNYFCKILKFPVFFLMKHFQLTMVKNHNLWPKSIEEIYSELDVSQTPKINK